MYWLLPEGYRYLPFITNFTVKILSDKQLG